MNSEQLITVDFSVNRYKLFTRNHPLINLLPLFQVQIHF